jgi:hypothetical protein
MRRYRKNRCDGDCDSLHRYSFNTPMSLGNVPIDMDEDYGINGARHILSVTKINLHTNWPYSIEESEAYWIDKIFKI